MRKLITTIFISLAISANAAGHRMKSRLMMKKISGTVESGSWINMKLEDNLLAKEGVQKYTAKTVDPIYNKKFTEVLIPAGALVHGEYRNDGNSCSFSVNTIEFKDTEIELKKGAYTTITASLTEQADCGLTVNYMSGQLMEFQMKVDIPDLYVIEKIKPEKLEAETEDFVEAYGNEDYTVTDIVKYTHNLMQVTVRINNDAVDRNKLVPLYYDDLGVAHNLNYMMVPLGNNVYVYLVLAHYDRFGFGLME